MPEYRRCDGYNQKPDSNTAGTGFTNKTSSEVGQFGTGIPYTQTYTTVPILDAPRDHVPNESCQSFQIILYMFHPHQCSAPNDLEITVPILGSTQIPFSIVIWFYIGANQAEPFS